MSELVQRDLNWARKITERLRLQATNYQEAREKVIATLVEARDGGAAELLGYASWTAYMADVLGDAPLRLERDARQELVAELHEAGMSTRAIAPIVGVDRKTVERDVRRGTNVPPETRIEYRQEQYPDGEWSREIGPVEVNVATGEVVGTDGLTDSERTAFAQESEAAQARPKVTGLDGKQYMRPEPKKPQRRALTDVARDAGWDVRKATERLERVWEDDRFSRNKEEVAELVRGHLMYVIETCQGFLDDINQSKEN